MAVSQRKDIAIGEKMGTGGLWAQTMANEFRHSPARRRSPDFKKNHNFFGPYKVGLAFWSLREQSGQNISEKIEKIGQNGQKWTNLASETRAV